MEPLKLALEGVGHRYPGADAETPSGVSTVIEPGQKALLVGPVGAGKTTLLLLIAGLRKGTGRILIGDRVVEGKSVARTRQGVGFLWQNPDDGLFLPGVLEDVALGPVNDGLSTEAALERARNALAALDAEHLAAREVARLSRGEKQLVALAGILARDPGLLLLDEPLSALDATAREKVLGLLAAHPATVLLATHEGFRTLEEMGFTTSIRLLSSRAAAGDQTSCPPQSAIE